MSLKRRGGHRALIGANDARAKCDERVTARTLHERVDVLCYGVSSFCNPLGSEAILFERFSRETVTCPHTMAATGQSIQLLKLGQNKTLREPLLF